LGPSIRSLATVHHQQDDQPSYTANDVDQHQSYSNPHHLDHQL
jgi:hypothetical protein